MVLNCGGHPADCVPSRVPQVQCPGPKALWHEQAQEDEGLVPEPESEPEPEPVEPRFDAVAASPWDRDINFAEGMVEVYQKATDRFNGIIRDCEACKKHRTAERTYSWRRPQLESKKALRAWNLV
eukprot:7200157-Prymnesium_polylepis.1